MATLCVTTESCGSEKSHLPGPQRDGLKHLVWTTKISQASLLSSFNSAANGAGPERVLHTLLWARRAGLLFLLCCSLGWVTVGQSLSLSGYHLLRL